MNSLLMEESDHKINSVCLLVMPILFWELIQLRIVLEQLPIDCFKLETLGVMMFILVTGMMLIHYVGLL